MYATFIATVIIRVLCRQGQVLVLLWYYVIDVFMSNTYKTYSHAVCDSYSTGLGVPTNVMHVCGQIIKQHIALSWAVSKVWSCSYVTSSVSIRYIGSIVLVLQSCKWHGGQVPQDNMEDGQYLNMYRITLVWYLLSQWTLGVMHLAFSSEGSVSYRKHNIYISI